MAEKFTFIVQWKITLLVVLFLPLLVSLGFWQLSRAQEKQTLQQSWLAEQALPAQHYRELLDSKHAYRRVFLEGEFHQHYWLVENKILAGKLGYHVISPFKTDLGDWILINRGWVEASAYREENPVLNTPQGKHRLTGTLIKPSDSKFIEHNPELMGSWPYRLLEIDFALMADQLNQPLEPKIVLMDADSPGALIVEWQPVNMSAEKHRAYALQWFAMAFALSVMWFVANTNVLKRFSND
ncbi:Cytochrome oxidase assembly protein ShyY1 [Alteromonadaceae bacterium Bs31]|nr:Cytochrome oxidase assembly protein ShyY1 [Alteromonadaceae bacterium Bs31]